MFAYNNNGLSFRAVDNTYTAQTGEKVYSDYATSDQLTADFPNYAAAIAAQNKTVANAPISAQINNIEAEGHRSVRSILIAQLNGQTPSAADIQKLQTVDNQIQSLRAQIQK